MRLLCIVFQAFSVSLVCPQADENGATPFLPSDTLNFAANDISNFWINSGLEDATRPAKELFVTTKVAAGQLTKKEAGEAYFDIAMGYWKAGEHDAQFRVLDKIESMDPDLPVMAEVHMLRGYSRIGIEKSMVASLEDFEKADAFCQKHAATADEATRRMLMQTRGSSLSLMGLAFWTDGRTEDAIRCYSTIVESPDAKLMMSDEALLGIYQDLSLIYERNNDFQKAQEQHAAIEKLVPTAKLSADRRLYFLFRAITTRFPDPRDAARLKALEELWNAREYELCRGILDVGCELCVGYHFSKEGKEQEFIRVGKGMNRRLAVLVDVGRPETLVDTPAFLRYSLLALDFIKKHGDAGLEREKLKSNLTRYFKDQPFKPSTPPYSDRALSIDLLALFVSTFEREFPEEFKKWSAAEERSIELKSAELPETPQDK